MPLDNPQFVGDLDSSNPKGTDSKTITDDSIRNFKEGVRKSFPNITGEVSSTHQDLNLLSGMQAATTKPLAGNAGQSVYFLYDTTAPLGTTLEPLDGNIRQLVVGSGGGATTGGSDNPNTLSDTVSYSVSGDTGITTIAHTHGVGNISVSSASEGVAVSLGGGGNCATTAHNHTLSGGTADSGTQTAHTHSFFDSGSTSVQFNPRYARGILVRLDA